MSNQFKSIHGIGLLHQLKAEVSLLNYHLNNDKRLVWQYLDKEEKNEKLAVLISESMRSDLGKRGLSDKTYAVVKPIFDRYWFNRGQLEVANDCLFRLMNDLGINKAPQS